MEHVDNIYGYSHSRHCRAVRAIGAVMTGTDPECSENERTIARTPNDADLVLVFTYTGSKASK